MNHIARQMDLLEQEYAAGKIEYADFLQEMKALQAEMRDYAQECAENAYHDVMGGY